MQRCTRIDPHSCRIELQPDPRRRAPQRSLRRSLRIFRMRAKQSVLERSRTHAAPGARPRTRAVCAELSGGRSWAYRMWLNSIVRFAHERMLIQINPDRQSLIQIKPEAHASQDDCKRPGSVVRTARCLGPVTIASVREKRRWHLEPTQLKEGGHDRPDRSAFCSSHA